MNERMGLPIHLCFHGIAPGVTKVGFEKLDLRTTGMEFASELVIKATLLGLRTTEVPITLHRDGRSRPPHLRSWRDGWRHLRFMLLFSPRWLFLFPGITMNLLGLIGLTILATGRIPFGKVVLDVGTMMACSGMLLIGFQVMCFAVFTRAFAMNTGLLPPNPRLRRFLNAFSLEWGVISGVAMVVIGSAIFGLAFWNWQKAGFQGLSYGTNLRRIIPASTLVVLGIQCLFGSFFLGVLGLRSTIRD